MFYKMLPSQPRRSFTLARKTQIIEEQRRDRMSASEICRRHNIQPHQLADWKRAHPEARFVSKSMRGFNSGRKSIYSDHEDAIRDFVMLQRTERAVVNIRSIIIKLEKLYEEARAKTFRSKQMWAHRFILRNGFSLRRITRTITLGDEELANRRSQFFELVESRFARNGNTIFVNMDQTSVMFGDTGTITVNRCGARSVQVRGVGRQTDRVTAALSIGSNGNKLAPFVIFKGTSDGRVARVAREFARRENHFPVDLKYSTNENAWMTERLMLVCIE